MENTNSVIEVYPKTYGNIIDSLVATSSDSSIVQILDTQKDGTHNAYDIKIRAINSGQATIAIAATGFSSLELPITVAQYSAGITNLLIKATPGTFSTSGPNAGYVSVETTNPDGIPTPVSVDTQIKLSVSDSNIVGLTDDQMIIKQGSYFATEKFTINKGGTAQIFASSATTQPVTATVTVNNPNQQYTLQAYAFPKVINNLKDATGYVIVQLLDSSGTPVIAKDDIPISIRVVDVTNVGSINTSTQSPSVQINDGLIIKKGSYWAYVPVQFTSVISSGNNFAQQGQLGLFNVYISSKGYSISTNVGSIEVGNQPSTADPTSQRPCVPPSLPPSVTPSAAMFITCPQNVVIDNKTPFLSTIPILATGNQELIGALRLADPNTGTPILANSDLSFKIDSSDTSTLSVSGVRMDSGSQVALVFAQVGNNANPVTLNVVSNVPQAVSPNMFPPPAATTSLLADPLISTVLPHTQFPLAIYFTKNGALDLFKNTLNGLISPQESISPGQLSITTNDPIFLADETLLKDGAQNMAITTPDYSSTFTVTGASLKPSSILLDFPNQIFSNSDNLVSIELLNDKQLPMLADQDMNIKLVSSNPSVLNVPDSVQINKGSYYVTFDAKSKTAGTAEIAVLTDEIPLSKFDMTVTSLTPDLKLDSTDHIDPNYHFDATVTATYQNSPLSGLGVVWTVTGATIQQMDALTDKDGNAKISLISSDPNTVNIQATISGGPYGTTSVSKQVQVNQPLLPASPSSDTTNTQQNGFSIMGINPLFLVIPVTAGVAILVLKKREMLEGITEKLSIADKFSGIKERMSELRQK